jgi:23S rRNA (uracil1939-C5)-methyltransferase
MDAWRGGLGQTALLPCVPELRGAVRAMTRGFSFTLEGGSAWPRHQEFREALPWMQELWWVPEGKSRRLLWSRPASEGAGASFVQVNPVVASELREWVVSLAALQNPATAIDAYAGTGDFAAALAARGTRVTAIERDRDAARACAARLPAGSTTIAEPVERAIRRVLPADLVVLNPPRAGLHESVADALRNGQPRPRRLIYVSCDPATLARDLRRLGGVQLRSVRGFDMFPQTAHVETVCELDGAE